MGNTITCNMQDTSSLLGTNTDCAYMFAQALAAAGSQDPQAATIALAQDKAYVCALNACQVAQCAVAVTQVTCSGPEGGCAADVDENGAYSPDGCDELANHVQGDNEVCDAQGGTSSNCNSSAVVCKTAAPIPGGGTCDGCSGGQCGGNSSAARGVATAAGAAVLAVASVLFA